MNRLAGFSLEASQQKKETDCVPSCLKTLFRYQHTKTPEPEFLVGYKKLCHLAGWRPNTGTPTKLPVDRINKHLHPIGCEMRSEKAEDLEVIVKLLEEKNPPMVSFSFRNVEKWYPYRRCRTYGHLNNPSWDHSVIPLRITGGPHGRVYFFDPLEPSTPKEIKSNDWKGNSMDKPNFLEAWRQASGFNLSFLHKEKNPSEGQAKLGGW